MNFTERQQEAIRAESHLLMEAGAGCGKTATLVAKVMHALGAERLPGERAAQPCELDQIVAITFTEAAAADLKAALRKAFRQEARRDPAWRARLYGLERARIGTIHAFCASLLREWGPRIGIDPGFVILDAVEGQLLRRDVVREVLFDALRRGDPEAADLVAELGFGEVAELLGGAASRAEEAAAVLAGWCTRGALRVDRLRALTEASGHPWHPHDPEAARLAAGALRLAVEVRTRGDERLQREGALDFDSLIQRVRDATRVHPELVARYRSTLRWLFIDEFQDTDDAQKEIAYRICGLEGEPDAFAPRLCVVGDPKQSIYRFRGADVSVWNQVAEDFGRWGLPVIPLARNFRSRTPIVEYANATFEPLMAPGADAGAGRHEVHYTPLQAARDFPGDDGLVEVLTTAGSNAAARRREEADRIARRILGVRAEACIREVDRDGVETMRTPQWRDIALLFRARTGVGAYEEAFRRAGIPFYVSTGGGFFGRREVRDLVLLLTALADPRDDLAWAGVLRSPWVGLTDEALMRLRAERGQLARLLDRPLPGEDGERLARARAWLEELRTLRDRVRPSALVDRALERSGYAAQLLLQEDGELALANLRKLVRMADSGEARPLGELVAWLEARAAAADREPEARLHTAGEDVVVLTTVHAAKGLEWPIVIVCDLERDVVGGGRRGKLLFDLDHGFALRVRDRDAEDEPVAGNWERMAAHEELLDVAEEKRIWYVAATRARDRLILSGHVPGMTGSRARVAQWLLSGGTLEDDAFTYAHGGSRFSGPVLSDLPAPETAAAPHPPTPDELAGAAPLDPAVLARLGETAPVRPRRRHSATELMRLEKSPEEHHRVYALGLPPRFPAPPAAVAAGPAAGLTAQNVGNIVHGVLERLREEAELDALLELEVLGEVGDEAAASLTLETRGYLRGLIERTRHHPSIAPLYEAGAEPELAYTWLMRVDGVPVALRGAMDLVGLAEPGPEIVDFKSTAVHPGGEDAVARRYHVQRDVYAAAIAELSGRDPRLMRFFFPATGGEAVDSLDAAAIAAARARVEALVRGVWPSGADSPSTETAPAPPARPAAVSRAKPVQGDLFE